MKSLKDLTFLNFKPWVLFVLLLIPSLASAYELNEWIAGMVPLPATAWSILLFIMGFLALSKHRNIE